MELEEITRDTRAEFQRWIESIERQMSWCELYTWEIECMRQKLEERRYYLLRDLNLLEEGDEIYGSGSCA